MKPWKNRKSITLDPILGANFFSWIYPSLVIIQYCKLSSYAISTKNNKPNLKKLQKKQDWPFWPKITHKFSFLLGIVLSYRCIEFQEI